MVKSVDKLREKQAKFGPRDRVNGPSSNLRLGECVYIYPVSIRQHLFHQGLMAAIMTGSDFCTTGFVLSGFVLLCLSHGEW